MRQASVSGVLRPRPSSRRQPAARALAVRPDPLPFVTAAPARQVERAKTTAIRLLVTRILSSLFRRPESVERGEYSDFHVRMRCESEGLAVVFSNGPHRGNHHRGDGEPLRDARPIATSIPARRSLDDENRLSIF